METENKNDRKFSLTTLVYKTIAGFSGGLAGGIVLMGLYIFSVNVTGDLGSIDPKPSMGSVIVGAVLLLLANVMGALLSSFLFSLVEKDKYKHKIKAFYQIGLLNLMVFVLLIPVYVISNLAVPEYLMLIFILQIVFTIQASHLLFEQIANPKGGISAIYGTTIALLVSTIVLALLSILIKNSMIVLIVAFPIVWGLVGFSQSIISLIEER